MPSSALSWIALVLGVFYAAGALFLLRSLAMGSLIDRALAALGSEEADKEQRQTRLLTVGALLTFASGLALLALSRWAPAVFALNALFQGGYLLWATRVLPPEDEVERAGRRSTIRAFFVYLVALAFVWFAGTQGVWQVWLEPSWLELGVLAAATALAGLAVRLPVGRRQAAEEPPVPAEPREPPVPAEPREPSVPERLRLAPEIQCWPLWNDATGEPVDPDDLGLSAELLARIDAWDDRFQATYPEEDPASAGFADVAEERAWVSEGLAVAESLRQEWDGDLVVAISRLDAMLREAGRDLAPGQAVPLDARIGAECGVAEIGEAIERLDALARDKDALPEWDGDSANDIGRAQELLSHILATVPARYDADVRGGLDSAEPQTRTWVEHALRLRAGPA